MFLDTVDMTGPAELAHRRLADYIWFSGNPPRNRVPVLCEITKTLAGDWPPVGVELMEKGWLVSGEFLIHRGIISSLNDCKLRYAESFNRSCKMNRTQPLLVSEPHAVTGIVEIVKPKAKRSEAGGRRADVPATPAAAENGSAALSRDAATRLAGAILRNTTNWHYDNCKVTPDMFVARTLAGVLTPFEGRVSEKAVLTSWHEAAGATHKAAVDGLVKSNAAGYCIAAWRSRLSAAAVEDGGSRADDSMEASA